MLRVPLRPVTWASLTTPLAFLLPRVRQTAAGLSSCSPRHSEVANQRKTAAYGMEFRFLDNSQGQS